MLITRKLFLEIFHHRHILWVLSVQQLRNKYLGTLGGLIWAILHPILLLFVFWVALVIGLKSQVTGDQPYLLVLFCGLIVWMPFAEAIGASPHIIIGHSYLISKISFPCEILPLTNVISSFFSHFISFIFLILMLIFYQRMPSVSVFFLLYYIVCLFILMAGLSWLLSALNVIYRDTGQVVTIFLNMWFWITPIIWDPNTIPKGFSFLITYNPLAYIVKGYRNCILENSFHVNIQETIVFWIMAISFWYLGTKIFSKLKTSFADIL